MASCTIEFCTQILKMSKVMMMALLSATADINLKFVTPKIEGF